MERLVNHVDGLLTPRFRQECAAGKYSRDAVDATAAQIARKLVLMKMFAEACSDDLLTWAGRDGSLEHVPPCPDENVRLTAGQFPLVCELFRSYSYAQETAHDSIREDPGSIDWCLETVREECMLYGFVWSLGRLSERFRADLHLASPACLELLANLIRFFCSNGSAAYRIGGRFVKFNASWPPVDGTSRGLAL
jgi:hypothetical protein